MGDVDSSKTSNQALVPEIEQMRKDFQDLEDNLDDLYDYVYGELDMYLTDMHRYTIYKFGDLRKMLLKFATLEVFVVGLVVVCVMTMSAIQRSGTDAVGLGFNCRVKENVSLNGTNGTEANGQDTYRFLECSLVINLSLLYFLFWSGPLFVWAIYCFRVAGKKTERKTNDCVRSAAKKANKDKPEESYSATAMCQSEKNEAMNSPNQDIESETHSSKQSPPMDFLIPSESEIQEAKEGAEKKTFSLEVGSECKNAASGNEKNSFSNN